MSAFAEIIGRWSAGQQFSFTLTMMGGDLDGIGRSEILGDFKAFSIFDFDTSRPRAFEDFAKVSQRKLWTSIDYQVWNPLVYADSSKKAHGKLQQFPVVFTSGLGFSDLGISPEASHRFGEIEAFSIEYPSSDFGCSRI